MSHDSAGPWHNLAHTLVLDGSPSHASCSWTSGTWTDMWDVSSAGGGLYKHVYAGIPVTLVTGYTNYKLVLKLYGDTSSNGYSVNTIRESRTTGSGTTMAQNYFSFICDINANGWNTLFHIDNTTSNTHYVNYIDIAAMLSNDSSGDYIILNITPLAKCTSTCGQCGSKTVFQSYGTGADTYWEGYLVPIS